MSAEFRSDEFEEDIDLDEILEEILRRATDNSGNGSLAQSSDVVIPELSLEIAPGEAQDGLLEEYSAPFGDELPAVAERESHELCKGQDDRCDAPPGVSMSRLVAFFATILPALAAAREHIDRDNEHTSDTWQFALKQAAAGVRDAVQGLPITGFAPFIGWAVMEYLRVAAEGTPTRADDKILQWTRRGLRYALLPLIIVASGLATEAAGPSIIWGSHRWWLAFLAGDIASDLWISKGFPKTHWAWRFGVPAAAMGALAATYGKF